jgi:O-methyltransferase involved in polyketide biosynthesis
VVSNPLGRRPRLAVACVRNSLQVNSGGGSGRCAVPDWNRPAVRAAPSPMLRSVDSLDPTTPNVARMYDYYLGGTDNFPIDREAADRVLATSPEVRTTLRANRSFLGRVVRYLVADAGIEQFIDLGAGLPTRLNVHEVAQATNPNARVVYVDNDPAVVAHARGLLAGNDRATVIEADLRRPGEVLADPQLRRLVDLGNPTGVLMTAVLHFVSDADNPHAIVRRYVAAVTPGSYLALSLGTTDGVDPVKIAEAQRVYRGATSGLTYRSRAEIERFFDGFDLVDPGLVRLPHWRPVSEEAAGAESEGSEWMLGGLGRRR